MISNLNFLQKPMMLKSMNTCGMAAFHHYTQASLRQFWTNYVIWWFVAKSIIFFWNFLSFYAPSTPMSMHFFVLLGVRDFFKVNRGGSNFSTWTPSVAQWDALLLDIDAGAQVLHSFAPSSFFEWSSGSTLIFWR